MNRIVRREKRQRTSLGKLILWTFIGFNALMLYWIVAGVFAVTGPSGILNRWISCPFM